MSERLRPHTARLPATLLRVALLLAIVTIAHHVAMATPLHDGFMQMVTPGAQTHGPMQTSCDDSCPMRTVAVCPAVQAALPTVAPALLLLVAALVSSALWLGVVARRTVVAADWRPPPRHTLILFQTFRC